MTRRIARAALWIGALLIPLAVVLANGKPLLYYDSATYLDQGARALGLAMPPPEAVSGADTGTGGARPEGGDTGVAKVGAERAGADKTVTGSRSFIYALFVGGIFAVAGLPGVVAANLAAIGAAAMLVSRALVPEGGGAGQHVGLAASGLIAAGLASLPFYVAFVMPDIFAPVLILMIALLFSFGRALPRGAVVAAVLFALFAIVVHPSHLLIAVALTPLALFLGPAGDGRRLAFLLVVAGLLVAGGLAERLVFRVAVERVLHRQVVDLPFLTARLIDDGPGRQLLAARCPDPGYPTCALQAALAVSDNPDRFDAPNILFARDPGRGSYRLLDPATQQAVAEDQFRFVGDVVAAHPAGVVAAIGRNILTQLGYFSVEMTVPTDEIVAAIPGLTARLPADAGAGRVQAGFGALRAPLLALHAGVYLLSFLVLCWLVLGGRLDRSQVALVLITLAGIVVNAAVCGAVSEPAHRYGARVMFLLPMLAAMLWLSRRPRRGRRDRRPDPAAVAR